MFSSYQIGRIFGIRIRVHFIFLILLAGFGLDGLVSGGLIGAIGTVLFVCLVFGFVLLHELGHSLMAMRHGVRVHDITLLPIGGVARLEAIPEEPWTEIKIAVAGPLVNLAIAALLLPLIVIVTAGSIAFSLSLNIASILGQLFLINVMLACFNCLPAFPLDGGRVYRAFLARRYDYVTATDKAARVGKWVAIGLVVASLLFYPYVRILHPLWAVVLAVFIYSAGASEARAVRMKHMYLDQGMQPFMFWTDSAPVGRARPERRAWRGPPDA